MDYKVNIKNQRRGEEGEYVGRPSPLGNPYWLRFESERDKVCNLYETWFYEAIEEKNDDVVSELTRLEQILRDKKTLDLLCWCSPKRCHAQTIAAYLIRKVLS